MKVELVAACVRIADVVERMWMYAASHPDGFTVCLEDMSVPEEGISVAYSDTQNSFGREGLRKAVQNNQMAYM